MEPKEPKPLENIDSALAAFTLKAPRIIKSKDGQVGPRKYKYAPLDDLLEAVRQPLADCGLHAQVSIQCVNVEASALQGATALTALINKIVDQVGREKEAHKAFLSLAEGVSDLSSLAVIAVTTKIVHAASNTERAITLEGTYQTTKPQDLGIAITYLRRYGLMTILNLAADEDTDGARPQEASARPATVTSEQIAQLLALGTHAKVSAEKLCSIAQVARIEDIPAQHFPAYISRLEARAAQLKKKEAAYTEEGAVNDD